MNEPKKHVYLSGGMEYSRNEGADWRITIQNWIQDNLGFVVFNPNVESARYLAQRLPGIDFRVLKSADIARYSRIVRGIVDLDSREIAHRSDFVICYWDRSAAKGAGTKGELSLARFFRKPVYVVTRMKRENIPGWVLGCTTKIFSSWKELKTFLLDRYSRTAS